MIKSVSQPLSINSPRGPRFCPSQVSEPRPNLLSELSKEITKYYTPFLDTHYQYVMCLSYECIPGIYIGPGLGTDQYEPVDIIVHEFNPRGHNSKCRHWRSLENMTCYSLHKQTVPWNPFFSLAAVTEFLHSSTPGIKSLTFWPTRAAFMYFFRLFSPWNCIQWIVSSFKQSR